MDVYEQEINNRILTNSCKAASGSHEATHDPCENDQSVLLSDQFVSILQASKFHTFRLSRFLTKIVRN